jgi:hypothetical protein
MREGDYFNHPHKGEMHMDTNIVISILGVLFSVVAICVSVTNLWLSQLKHGQILMTKPTIFFFGFDHVDRPIPKIYVRTLLFSTASNGRVLENMYLLVKSPIGESIYSFWGHTNSDAKNLTRGSGLYIPKNGFLADHHFNPDPSQDVTNPFPVGSYEIEVIARQYADSTNRKLGKFELQLDQKMSASLNKENNGVMWSLNPIDQSYHAELRKAG